MKKQHVSLSVRVSLIVLGALILSAAIIGIFSFVLNRRDAIDLNAERARAIANSMAAIVDPDAFEQALDTGEKNDFWYTYKGALDKTYESNDVRYLYVIDSHYGSSVRYFAEGYPASGREDTACDLGDEQPANYFAQEIFDTVRTGSSTATGIYYLDDYGNMVSGFAPILGSGGNVIGAVGVDLNVDSVVASARQFGLMIILIAAVLCAAAGVIVALYIKRAVGSPLMALKQAAERLSAGDIDISVSSSRSDEIGMLIVSFQHMVSATRKQARAMEALAGGDLTIHVEPRCESDVMGMAIMRTLANLNDMFADINASTEQVSFGSRQMADGAQALAEGATEQAATVELLSRSIGAMAEQTQTNAHMAEKAASLADAIKQNAEKGTEQMDLMIKAVTEIDEASQAIGKVIKVIDDIAFQTNILAINAAVEAAHAGAQGKGFAVVAEEVRTLAQKSADSAKDTGRLIENSLEKARLGVEIAGGTSASLSEIVAGINESSAVVAEIAQSSKEQSEAILQINTGIDQVAQVIQQNSATAQQSAAASEEISVQADTLESLVSRFSLRQSERPELPSRARGARL